MENGADARMRVLFAVDGFKGSMTAAEAAAAFARGWRDLRPGDELVELPLADGGEGTLAAFRSVPGARDMPVRVIGADDREREAAWVLLPPTDDAPAGAGVVELAATCGIEQLEELRPLDAHTYGLGQAIAAALDHGVSRVIIGLGGSASTDGGTGALEALGARFLDADGHPVARGARGLEAIARAELAGIRPLPPAGVAALTDVRAPLTGEHGAAAVFGPQKGLSPTDVERADRALAQLAGPLPADPRTAGAGAAGGTGFGLLAWGARLAPGADVIGDLVGLRDRIRAADLVVTGEGGFDAQSATGKTTGHVIALAHELGTPVALIAGRVHPDADTSRLAASLSLVDVAGSPQRAMERPLQWAAEASHRLAMRLGRRA